MRPENSKYSNNFAINRIRKFISTPIPSKSAVVVPEPVPYRTLTKLKNHNSQKLLDRNLKCIVILVENASIYQNIIFISVE